MQTATKNLKACKQQSEQKRQKLPIKKENIEETRTTETESMLYKDLNLKKKPVA